MLNTLGPSDQRLPGLEFLNPYFPTAQVYAKLISYRRVVSVSYVGLVFFNSGLPGGRESEYGVLNKFMGVSKAMAKHPLNKLTMMVDLGFLRVTLICHHCLT